MKKINIIDTPTAHYDGSISFTMTDGHNDIKVHAIYVEGEGYRIKDYEVIMRGAKKDEKS